MDYNNHYIYTTLSHSFKNNHLKWCPTQTRLRHSEIYKYTRKVAGEGGSKYQKIWEGEDTHLSAWSQKSGSQIKDEII